MMRILIVKTSSLGDIVHAFPVVDWIKEYFPDAIIDWVVEKGGGATLVQAHPDIAQVFVVDTQAWRKALWKRSTWREMARLRRSLRSFYYDVLFDLQGNTKSTVFTAIARAKIKVGFGRRTVSEWPNLLFTNRKYNHSSGVNVREEYLILCRTLFQKPPTAKIRTTPFNLSSEEQLKKEEMVATFSGEPRLMICPGSRWENKRIADVTWNAFLGKVAAAYNLEIFLIYSGEEEKQRVGRIAEMASLPFRMIGELTLPLWHALMAEMDGIISVDSVGLHLAATTGVPTLSLFGPSRAAIFSPDGPQHASIQGNCPYGELFSRRCSRLRNCPTGACLKDLSVEVLFKNFQEWWSAAQNQRAFPPG